MALGSKAETLATLTDAFRERLPTRVGEVSAAVSDLLAHWEESRIESLFHSVHRLTGSAAIYGFPETSRASSDLERAVTRIMEEHLRPTPRLRAELRDLAQALEGTVSA
jgi:chemotaxis protein histidine kinase CheA